MTERMMISIAQIVQETVTDQDIIADEETQIPQEAAAAAALLAAREF